MAANAILDHDQKTLILTIEEGKESNLYTGEDIGVAAQATYKGPVTTRLGAHKEPSNSQAWRAVTSPPPYKKRRGVLGER